MAEIVPDRVAKLEREKTLVTSIFSFPTLFSKGFFSRVVKTRDSLIKGSVSKAVACSGMIYHVQCCFST